MTRRAVLQEYLISMLEGFGRYRGDFSWLVKRLHIGCQRGQIVLRQGAPGGHGSATFPIPKDLAKQWQGKAGGRQVFWFAQEYLANQTITPSGCAVTSRTVLLKQVCSAIHLLRMFWGVHSKFEQGGRFRARRKLSRRN